jgi:transposase
MKAQEKYKIIKRLVENHISKDYAAIKIGCTRRTINRLLKKYNLEGKAAFVHGNTGRKPVHSLSQKQKEYIITTKRTKKQINKLLRDMHKDSKSKKEKKRIEASIVEIEDAHS